MKRKKERFIWIGVTSSLIIAVLIIIILTLTAPPVSAQTNYMYNKEIEKYMIQFKNAFYFVSNNYVDEVPSGELFDGAMTGLFESLNDPYSLYLDEETLQSLNDTTQGEFGGVGLYISKSLILDENNPYGRKPYVEVISPIEGTPAYRAGIHSGDYIFKINGQSAKDLSTSEVSDLLRGEAGTPVDVTILRGDNISFDVTLKRAKIEIPTIKEDVIDDIGYLKIILFTRFTAKRVEETLKDFKKQKIKALVIDLRGNPGGLLDSVVDITDYFFNDGVIVSTKSRIERENHIHRARRGIIVEEDIPITILIDNGSASASEILTGALKDRERAIVIGQTTYGKGSVQTIAKLNQSEVKLTIARYYTPSGVNIDKTGIAPDIEIASPDYTDEELDSYRLILEKNLIREFVVNNSNITERNISEFIKELRSKDIVLSDYTLRGLISNEINRYSDNPPVYNLEYDDSLKKAIEYIKENNYEF